MAHRGEGGITAPLPLAPQLLSSPGNFFSAYPPLFTDNSRRNPRRREFWYSCGARTFQKIPESWRNFLVGCKWKPKNLSAAELFIFCAKIVSRHVLSYQKFHNFAAPWEGNFSIDGCCFNSTTGAFYCCLLYTSPSPRDRTRSRMPSSA